MKSKQATTHMTITVPVALKREMEKHGEINWSRTAAKAFEKRLDAEKILGAFAEPRRSDTKGYESKAQSCLRKYSRVCNPKLDAN